MCKGLKLPIPTSITWDDSDSESDTAVVYVSKSRLADLQRASSDVSEAALLELVDPTGLAETQPSWWQLFDLENLEIPIRKDEAF